MGVVSFWIKKREEGSEHEIKQPNKEKFKLKRLAT